MKKGKISIFIPIIVVIILAALGCFILVLVNLYKLFNPDQYIAPSGTTTYNSTFGHFALNIPATWAYLDSGPRGNQHDMEEVSLIHSLSSPYLNPQVTILRKDFISGKLEDVVNWGIARAQGHEIYQQLSIEPYNTQNYAGYLNTYNTIFGPPWLERVNECMDWYTIDKQVGYSFQFCALKVYWPCVKTTFDEMINSIELRN